MGDFITNMVTALTAINADWATWVVGALGLGAASKFAPRIIKRFM